MIAGIDTMTMVWGFRDPERPDDLPGLKENRRRVQILFAELGVKRATIVVPTIVVAELLITLPTQAHGRFLAELNKYFFCPPFDLKACGLAAELWIKHRELPEEERLNRRTLKADSLIVATAKSAGATVFYSHDRKCRTLAEQAGMIAKDLPEHSEDLLTEAEIRQGNPPKMSERPRENN